MPDATTEPTHPTTKPSSTARRSPLPEQTRFVGAPLDRLDGRAKVTGSAKYAAEFSVDNVAHAVAFVSTIAKGIVMNIDSSETEKLSGVLAVIIRKNAGLVMDVDRHPNPPAEGSPGQTKALLQNDVVHYAGQFLGLVVAETLEQAMDGASRVKITYGEQTPTLDMEHPIELVKSPPRLRGDVEAGFAKSDVKVEQTYITSVVHHNPMEMHATLAAWDGDKLTLYDATQHVRGTRRVVATALDVPLEDIRVIDPFVGGGFGSKGSCWPNSYLAALAARYVGRPVKFMLTRRQMFTQAGYRPQTIQKVAIGADSHGKLLSLSHDTTSQTSDFDEWMEGSSRQTLHVYSCPNARAGQALARVNQNTPAQMRAPGSASGTFALESAMDELAYKLKLDPLELRLRNYAEQNEDEKKPYTSKGLRECYRQGAERFGWNNRPIEPRSMQRGNLLVGWGMGTAVYPAEQSPCSAAVRFSRDGTINVTAAAHDLGTGTYTILAQIASEVLGIDPSRVKVELGDTVLPTAPGAGGSRTAVSAGSAVLVSAQQLIRNIAHYAINDPTSPLSGQDVTKIIARDGQLVLVDDDSAKEALAAVFGRNGGRPIVGASNSVGYADAMKYSRFSWGAQFAEVTVDPMLGEIRLTRFVGAYAAGRILNVKTGRSQILGAIVMGTGMALLEKTHLEPNHGRFITDNLADYMAPVNADIPDLDVIFVDEKDDLINPLGAKGIGELGITGVAGAIANAVFHATGKRIRRIPISIEDVMDA